MEEVIVQNIIRGLQEEVRYSFVAIFKDCDKARSDIMDVKPLMEKVSKKGENFIQLMEEVSSRLPMKKAGDSPVKTIKLEDLNSIFDLLSSYPAERYTEIRDTVKRAYAPGMYESTKEAKKSQRAGEIEHLIEIIRAVPETLA